MWTPWQSRPRFGKLMLLFVVAVVFYMMLYLTHHSYLMLKRSAYKRYLSYTHSKEFAMLNTNLTNATSRIWQAGIAEIYETPEHPFLKSTLHSYVLEIELVRRNILSSSIVRKWPTVSSTFNTINASNEDYFSLLKDQSSISTVFLQVDRKNLTNVLPINKFYNYGSTVFGCDRMTNRQWAIYPNGDELYNKSCTPDLSRTLLSHEYDMKSLSMGLPYIQRAQKNNVILTFINIFEYAIIDKDGSVFTNNVSVNTQRCSRTVAVPQDQDIHDIPIYDEVFTITQQTQIWYYHLTIEDLSRISPYLTFLHEHQHIKVHISFASFHISMLEMLGISRERVIWGAVRARVAYLPAGTTCGRPAVFTTSLLSLLFRKHTEKSEPKPSRDIIILMQRSDPNRQLLNHEAIYTAVSKIADSHNLQLKVFSDSQVPPVEEYIELFYRAKVVIGPHGSGFANIIFTQPGTLIIEGLCYMEDWYKSCWKAFIIPWICTMSSRFSLTFRNLAAVLGSHYYGIVREDDCLYISPEEVTTPLIYYLNHI